MEKDTIFFSMIPVYDTVRQDLRNREIIDSLVLSVDEKPERIILELSVLYSGGAKYISLPRTAVV